MQDRWLTSHWSERVPQDTFRGSIVLRSSNWFGGKLLSFGGTRHSILRSPFASLRENAGLGEHKGSHLKY